MRKNIPQLLLKNIEDALVLGPRYPLRHVASLLGAQHYTVNARHIGSIELRSGSSDAATFRQVFVEHSYALPEAHHSRVRSRYLELLEQGLTPLIVDAGANVGAATRWFAKEYPKAVVAAVEPEPSNVGMLRKNTADLQNVRIVPAAVGAEPGSVAMSWPLPNEGWSVRTARSESGTHNDVPLVTISDLREPGEVLLIVKVDIEGFEADLFKRNTEWVDEVTCIFVEPHDWMLPDDRSSRNFQQVLLGRNFDILISGDNLVFVRA